MALYLGGLFIGLIFPERAYFYFIFILMFIYLFIYFFFFFCGGGVGAEGRDLSSEFYGILSSMRSHSGFYESGLRAWEPVSRSFRKVFRPGKP